VGDWRHFRPLVRARRTALLFENVKGYAGMPLVTNLISTTAQIALAFGTEPDEEKIMMPWSKHE